MSRQLKGKRIVITAGAVMVVVSCSTASSRREAKQRSKGESLVIETEAAVAQLDQLIGAGFDCVNKGNTYGSCPAWRSAYIKADVVSHILKFDFFDPPLLPECSREAKVLGAQFATWSAALDEYKTNENPASLKPRSAITELSDGTSKLRAACVKK
jgi:hypothetical protein